MYHSFLTSGGRKFPYGNFRTTLERSTIRSYYRKNHVFSVIRRNPLLLLLLAAVLLQRLADSVRAAVHLTKHADNGLAYADLKQVDTEVVAVCQQRIQLSLAYVIASFGLPSAARHARYSRRA